MQSNYEKQPLAKQITILGVDFKVTKLTINGQDAKFEYDASTRKLLINGTIDLRKQFIIVWT